MDNNTEFSTYTGTFTGMEMPQGKHEGTTKTGKPWKLWKLKFSHIGNDSTAKTITFKCFSPLMKSEFQPEQLQMGSRYKVRFKTDEFNLQDGTPAKSKTVIFMVSATGQDRDGFEQTSQPPQQPTQAHADDSQLQQFVDSYKQAVSNPSFERPIFDEAHFIGVFYKTFMANDPQLQKLEKVFEEQVLGKK